MPMKIDYTKINTHFAREIPRMRKATSEQLDIDAREKKHQEMQSYCEKQRGRVPD
jgi:hypothetical protein